MKGVGADLLACLLDQRSRMIEFLEKLAVLESPSSDAGTQSAVRALLAGALASLGFLTVELAGRSSGGQLYARPSQRDRAAPRQLLIGHFDTVWPVGTLGDMPFRVEGDIVRGPGVFDMKGGLVQIVFALSVIRELSLVTSVTPVVFLNSDEEIGSRESTRHIVRLARISDRALILEPSLGPAGAIKTARKGVGRYVVTVKGRAAHAGLDPEQGASAILELSFVIQKLFQLNDPERGITVNVGTIDGGLRPNVIAPESKAVIDVRVATQEDAERVHAAIHALEPTTEGITLEVDGAIGRPALEPTPRNQALWRRAQVLGRELGLELAEARAGGGSDGNTTSLYTATLDGLGPVGDGAHAHHEYLNIERTIERAALLALLLLSPPLEEH
ncbi:MAG TPA: M20 family metallopeptidase [Gammaproteobacteria bacterium]